MMDFIKDLDDLSSGELEEYSTALKADMAKIIDERIRIQAAMSKRTSMDRAEEIASGLSSDEKEALGQVLGVEGFAIGGVVGTPGK